MKKNHYAYRLAGILALLPCVAWAADAPVAAVKLSLADALKLGREHSALLQASAARVTQASAHLAAAGARATPTASIAHWAGQNTGGLDEDIVVAQTLELAAKRRPKVQAASAELDATRADQLGTARDLAFTIQSTYYGAARADVEVKVADDAVQTARAFANAAAVRFRAGDIPKNEVLRSQMEVASAYQSLDAAEGERDNRYAELRSLLGFPETTPVSLTDTLDVKPVAYRVSDLVTFGLVHRPDVKAADLRGLSLAAGVEAARNSTQPDVFLEARHMSIYQIGGGDSIRFGVTFPIGDQGQHRAEVAAARAAAAEQSATVAETTRVARLEIETAYNDLTRAQHVVEAFRSGRLDQAKQLLAMAQFGYARGASSYLELLDAQREYRSAQTDYVRAQAAYQLALASLQRALGGQLP